MCGTMPDYRVPRKKFGPKCTIAISICILKKWYGRIEVDELLCGRERETILRVVELSQSLLLWPRVNEFVCVNVLNHLNSDDCICRKSCISIANRQRMCFGVEHPGVQGN